MNSQQYAQELRMLADLFDKLPPDVDPPTSLWLTGDKFTMSKYYPTKEQLISVVKAMPGHWEKRYDEGLFNMVGEFSRTRIWLSVDREQVCKKITRTQAVERKIEIVPAQFETKMVVEEVTEWECPNDPLLANGVTESVQAADASSAG